MRRILGIAACLVLTAVFAPPAWADRCPFSTVDNPHDCDDPNPLKCKKCEEIAAQIAKHDPNVWTLDLAVTAEDFKRKYTTDPTLAKSLARKFGVPRRVEIKNELGASEVYWYVYYEVTNTDELERPCWIHVTAESDKGKNTVFYNDSIVPEVLEELKKIVGVKEGETLYTSTELCHPGQEQNKLPSKDNPTPQAGRPGEGTLPKVNRDGFNAKSELVKPGASGIYVGADAKLAMPMIKAGETRKCVAVFKTIDTEFNQVTVYFHGLANTTTSIPTTEDKPDSLNPEASPIARAAEELRLVNDNKMQEPEQNKRKVVERVCAVEYQCLGDEFEKSSRQIVKNEEQALRPKNIEKEPGKPPRYHDVGVFGTEVPEADTSIEGKKSVPYNFLGKKWVQTEKTIKSDLR